MYCKLVVKVQRMEKAGKLGFREMAKFLELGAKLGFSEVTRIRMGRGAFRMGAVDVSGGDVPMKQPKLRQLRTAKAGKGRK